jgi:hypothetical protein
MWGYCKAAKIETMQNWAMRIFLGVHKFTANDVLLGDLRWMLSDARNMNMMIYWNRVIKMDDCKLTFF